MIVKLWETFVGEDATLVEVNPLVRDPQDQSSRSTARSRSTTTPASATPATPSWSTSAREDPLEAKAKAKDLNYVKLDGEVGIIGNGAGW